MRDLLYTAFSAGATKDLSPGQQAANQEGLQFKSSGFRAVAHKSLSTLDLWRIDNFANTVLANRHRGQSAERYASSDTARWLILGSDYWWLLGAWHLVMGG
jgi:hypothetical protein